MTGLLKNNFYTARSNARVLSVFMLLLGVIAVIILNQPLLTCYMLLAMIGFSLNAIASIRKEYVSKWGKYKLTVPCKKADIVRSYYISQLFWLVIGILFAGTTMGVSWIFHGCPFDRNIDTLTMFALGISISLFMGAIFLPLFYFGGEERSEVFLIISLLCAIGIAAGIVVAINFFFDPGIPTIVLGAILLLVSSIVVFTLSYPLTVSIFKKKDY